MILYIYLFWFSSLSSCESVSIVLIRWCENLELRIWWLTGRQKMVGFADLHSVF